jgi:ABC-type nickel/cobalt efflux system permease component RcnA
MWLLFVPILICLGIALLVGALFQGVFWVVGGAWPWLLIGLGAWMFWHQDGRHYRRRHDVRRTRSIAQPRPQNLAHTPSRARSQPDLPIDVQVKVEQIRRKVEVLLGYADRFPPFSQDLHLVRQTASDYLPRTINAFLAMKPEDVDKQLNGTAKTARQELRDQLDLLDRKLDDIAQDLQRQDADRLLANRRFLEARFGARTNEPTPIV